MGKKRIICADCGKPLSRDEAALNKKLIALDVEAFQCLDCMSEALGCDAEDLRIKIQEFKEQGCTLFI